MYKIYTLDKGSQYINDDKNVTISLLNYLDCDNVDGIIVGKKYKDKSYNVLRSIPFKLYFLNNPTDDYTLFNYEDDGISGTLFSFRSMSQLIYNDIDIIETFFSDVIAVQPQYLTVLAYFRYILPKIVLTNKEQYYNLMLEKINNINNRLQNETNDETARKLICEIIRGYHFIYLLNNSIYSAVKDSSYYIPTKEYVNVLDMYFRYYHYSINSPFTSLLAALQSNNPRIILYSDYKLGALEYKDIFKNIFDIDFCKEFGTKIINSAIDTCIYFSGASYLVYIDDLNNVLYEIAELKLYNKDNALSIKSIIYEYCNRKKIRKIKKDFKKNKERSTQYKSK